MTLDPISIGGRAGRVAYLDKDWNLVDAQRATMAKVVFDDGGRAFYAVTRPRVAEYDEDKHPRDERGRWTDGGGDGDMSVRDIPFGKTMNAEKLEKRVAEERDKLANGLIIAGGEKAGPLYVQVTEQQMEANLEARFAQATQEQLAEKDWYTKDAGGFVLQMQDKYGDRLGGATRDQIAAVVATTSPNTAWDEKWGTENQSGMSNQLNAERILDRWAENPTINISAERLAEVNAAMSAMKGDKWSAAALPREPGAYTFRELAAMDPRTAMMFNTEVFDKGFGFGTMPTNVIPALAILSGRTPEKAFSPDESKVRSFYNNIVKGLDEDRTDRSATLDVHMMRALTNAGLEMEGAHYKAMVSNPPRYEYYRRVLERVAERHGMIPREFQAVIWHVVRDRVRRGGEESSWRNFSAPTRAQVARFSAEGAGGDFEDGAYVDESLVVQWFTRFFAHEDGKDVSGDPVFGEWSADDEAIAQKWRRRFAKNAQRNASARVLYSEDQARVPAGEHGGGQFAGKNGGGESADETKRSASAEKKFQLERAASNASDIARPEHVVGDYHADPWDLQANPWANPPESAYTTKVAPENVKDLAPSTRYVAAYGQEFARVASPEEIAKYAPEGNARYREAHGCYGNATRLCIDNPNLTYVEGWGVLPTGHFVGHGWAVDEKGTVIDPTWDNDRVRNETEGQPIRYFGVPYDRIALGASVKSGFYGVMHGSPQGAMRTANSGGWGLRMREGTSPWRDTAYGKSAWPKGRGRAAAEKKQIDLSVFISENGERINAAERTALLAQLKKQRVLYSEDQARDDHGRWTSGGATDGGGENGSGGAVGVSVEGDSTWYSFPQDGKYDATLLKQIPIDEKNASSWDSVQSIADGLRSLGLPEPKSGEALVLRIGNKSEPPSLAGKNGASVDGLAKFIAQESGDYRPSYAFKDNVVSAWSVKIHETTDYNRMQGGREIKTWSTRREDPFKNEAHQAAYKDALLRDPSVGARGFYGWYYEHGPGRNLAAHERYLYSEDQPRVPAGSPDGGQFAGGDGGGYSNETHDGNGISEQDVFNTSKEFGVAEIGAAYTAPELKQEISREVSDVMTKLDSSGRWGQLAADRQQEIVSSCLRTWADSSGDHHPISVGMQISAAKEFGIPEDQTSHLPGSVYEQADRMNGAQDPRLYGDVQMTTGELNQLFLRAQYENTQQYFRDRGMKEVTLLRGAAYGKDDDGKHPAEGMVNLRMAPMSSWTTSRDVAEEFAFNTAGDIRDGDPYMHGARVPVDRIIGTFRTGFGCKGEQEFVMLGRPAIGYSFNMRNAGWLPRMFRDYYRYRASAMKILKKLPTVSLDRDIWNADWPKRHGEDDTKNFPESTPRVLYSEDQPRVPAGEHGGGQFAGKNSGGDSSDLGASSVDVGKVLDATIGVTKATYDLKARSDKGEKIPAKEWMNSISKEDQAKVVALVDAHRAAEPEFRDLIGRIGAEHGMTLDPSYVPNPNTEPREGTYFFGPLKGEGRIVEKSLNDYNGHIGDVTDVLRMTYVVRDEEQARAVYESIGKLDSPDYARDRFTKPTEAGYRDIMTKITLSNGLRAEVQINVPRMIVAKEAGHGLYEQQRSVPRSTPQWEMLNDQQVRLYNDAWWGKGKW